ncbi:hypothetical protein L1049_014475 [Liquidambar formosana]|uniref:Uncharacterized protein n=1 Tax=Liquidambar formosana TaxID=63359 RepID=A0AAP0RVZ5_LIQFO
MNHLQEPNGSDINLLGRFPVVLTIQFTMAQFERGTIPLQGPLNLSIEPKPPRRLA